MNAWTNLTSHSRFLALAMLWAALGVAPTAYAQIVDYDPPPPGSPWGCCGAVFFPDGVFHETRGFTDGSGAVVTTGSARLVPSCFGGAGNSLNLNNVNVRIDPRDLVGGPGGPGVELVSFRYRDCGGSVNLTVNGHHVWWHNDFSTIPPMEFNIVNVNYTHASVWMGNCWEGTVTLTAMPGFCIDQLAIGGQEMCIDDVMGDIECICPEDLNGDGVVNVSDLLLIMAAWGACGGCPEDLNGDGVVNIADLLQIFTKWGSC
jgi:hypothetical protein